MSAQTFILPPTDRDRIADNLRAFVMQALPGKELRVEVCEYRKPRSDKQRKALFAAAYKPIMEYMGLRGERDKEDLHAFFCGEYWGWHQKLRNKPVRTTTRNERGDRDVIDKRAAMEFYDFIQRQAAVQGIYVPDPDPFWREQKAA